MLVREIMTPDVEVVDPDTMIAVAAQKMESLNTGVMPVCDGERLVGMLTDRDITVRATAAGRDPKKTHVRDMMTPEVIYCYDDQDVAEAALTMEEHQIRRLPVVNREHKLVGIVALGDLAVDTGDEEMSGEVIEEISKPAKPDR